MTAFLYPHETKTRRIIDISGVWKFKLDKNNEGRDNHWKDGLSDTTLMAVPASYNDISTEKAFRDHCGDVWYETDFYIAEEWQEKEVYVRFGSATHRAIVYVNGQEVVSHDGGYMPFAGKLNDVVKFGEKNTMVVVVNNELSRKTIPCGDIVTHANGTREVKPFFDFFNYAGIHRAVKLMALPKQRIDDINVLTDFDQSLGKVGYAVSALGAGDVSVELFDEAGKLVAAGEGSEGSLTIDNVKLWQPGNAYLYTLQVSLSEAGQLQDQYPVEVGVRTVKVEGTRFLINNEPFYFKGFGKHEDSHIHGRGYDAALNLRDMELLDWIGANSIRTSHYPYSEEFMQLADRKGLVVINETPAVGQFDVMMNFMAA
ncbi:glycoside hydrolase family 2 TIM barrel-domain containing protein, partial [Endozoicomonas lisbonensis]